MTEIEVLLAGNFEKPIHYISANEFGWNEILKLKGFDNDVDQLDDDRSFVNDVRVVLDLDQVVPFKIHYFKVRK